VTATCPIIALDIDGTIVDHAGQLSARVREAVRAAVAAPQLHVVLVTGRSTVGLQAMWNELGLVTGHAVCSNGAVALRFDPELEAGHEVTHSVLFRPRAALEAIRHHLPEAIFACERLGVGFNVTRTFPPGELHGEQTVVAFDDLLHPPVARCIVRSPEYDCDHYVEILQQVGLPDVTFAVGWSAWLDVSAAGVDKAFGLAKVTAELGGQARDVIAIGDGRNDLPMFAWAGRSIAMGQASPDVLTAADEVCGAVSCDGLAVVLEGLIETLTKSQPGGYSGLQLPA
jgi:Cof subfamily protein (haloacid dehalogenase superfamily)